MLTDSNAVVKCDRVECNHTFYLSDIKIKNKSISSEKYAGLKVKYFKCPKCKHMYIIDVTDIEARLDIKQLKLLIKKQNKLMQQRAGEVSIRNNLTKITSLQQKLLARSKELRKECV